MIGPRSCRSRTRWIVWNAPSLNHLSQPRRDISHRRPASLVSSAVLWFNENGAFHPIHSLDLPKYEIRNTKNERSIKTVRCQVRRQPTSEGRGNGRLWRVPIDPFPHWRSGIRGLFFDFFIPRVSFVALTSPWAIFCRPLRGSWGGSPPGPVFGISGRTR